jgi:hypothetical protein
MEVFAIIIGFIFIFVILAAIGDVAGSVGRAIFPIEPYERESSRAQRELRRIQREIERDRKKETEWESRWLPKQNGSP